MNKDFVTLTATPRLLELLSSIDHQIAYELITQIKYRNEAPLSFLDFGETNDTISFVLCNKVWDLMNDYDDDYKEQAWKTNRSSIKIGKLVKKIFGDYFPVNQPKGVEPPKPQNDIESFVNMFKAEKDKNNSYERFELVKGQDIKFWYNQENYSRFIQEDTTLGKSCLRHREAGKFLEMYVKNPDLINMLILKDDVNRLRGRAIVWNLTEPAGRIYLERIYTISDCDVELYKHYAREHGWLYKSRQTYGFNWKIIDGKNGNEYEWNDFPMRVKLNITPNDYYPYLDTLCVYNPETGILSNEGDLLRKPPYIKLTSANGEYIDEAEHRDMVYSIFYGNDIPREGSVWVDLDDDWVYEDDVVLVYNTGGKKSHKNSSLICKSDILGKVKYFLKRDCTYSDYLNTWIYTDSVRVAFLDKEKTKKVIIHFRLMTKFFTETKDGIFRNPTDGEDALDQYLQKYNYGSSRRPHRRSDSVQEILNNWSNLVVNPTRTDNVVGSSTQSNQHPGEWRTPTEEDLININNQNNIVIDTIPSDYNGGDVPRATEQDYLHYGTDVAEDGTPSESEPSNNYLDSYPGGYFYATPNENGLRFISPNSRNVRFRPNPNPLRGGIENDLFNTYLNTNPDMLNTYFGDNPNRRPIVPTEPTERPDYLDESPEDPW